MINNTIRVWYVKFNGNWKHIDAPRPCDISIDADNVLLITHENILYARIRDVSDMSTVPIKSMNWLQRIWKGYA